VIRENLRFLPLASLVETISENFVRWDDVDIVVVDVAIAAVAIHKALRKLVVRRRSEVAFAG
jgi:hypothetical protein